MDATTKDYPSRNHNEQEDEDFDRAEGVHNPDSPVGSKGVHAGHGGDNCNCYPSFGPISHSMIGCNQYILCKNDAAGCCGVCQHSSFST